MRVPLPLATLAMLGVNTAILLWLSPRAESVEAWGFVPAQPSLMSAFTSLFVHAGWLHWLKNALFLGLFGIYVERALGAGRWLALYFISGFGAIGIHWAISLTIQPSLYREGLVGASGAISGLVGYFALRFYRRRVRLLWASPNRWGLAVPMWVGVLAWVLLQGIGAILEAGQPTPSAIGYWAHLGGFATGLLLALLWGAGAQGEQEFLLEQAERALQQGAAGDTLRWLGQLPPTREPRVRYLQGAAWALLGDAEEAYPPLRDALQHALQQGNYTHAAHIADLLCEIDRLHALDAATLHTLLRHAERHQDRTRATRWLETLTNKTDLPNRPEWLLMHARLLQQQGQADAAQAILQRLITDYPDSLQAALAKLESKR
ncbi:MAG: rhomboid family intramembrane serine protease [Fimbriimonadales bacterium]